jgi:hypothetical protein
MPDADKDITILGNQMIRQPMNSEQIKAFQKTQSSSNQALLLGLTEKQDNQKLTKEINGQSL